MSDKQYPEAPEPNACGGYYCSENHGHIDCRKDGIKLDDHQLGRIAYEVRMNFHPSASIPWDCLGDRDQCFWIGVAQAVKQAIEKESA